MRRLAHFIQQHLLLSCIAISMALHGLVIFWTDSDAPQQSSKGSSHTILLESISKKMPKINPKPKEEPKPQSSLSTTELSALSVVSPSIAGNTKKIINEKKLTQKSKPEQSNKPIRQNRKVTSNSGDLADQSGKDLSVEQQYQQAIYSHLLKKSENSPYWGEASVQLTLIRAGIATQINIELIDGPKEYKKWIQLKILGANPFPAFPKSMTGQQFTMSVTLKHEL